MGFDGLLGNDRLKENLRRSIESGRISHFYLICGPAGSGKKTLARLLAAAILCSAPQRPCLRCSVCRKVMADTHPDLCTLTDPEHKTVSVKLVRQMREEMFLRPNEADRKIYILAQELGIEGQNALLKLLEEPPAYGVFLMLTDNPEKLLPTVRSRCTELILSALPEPLLHQTLAQRYPQADRDRISGAVLRSGGWLGQAQKLLEADSVLSAQTEAFGAAFAAGDPLGLLRVLAGMEKWKREPLLDELEQWLAQLQNALISRSGIRSISPLAQTISARRSSREILGAIRAVQKAIEYGQGNVSVAAICGWLEWSLR